MNHLSGLENEPIKLHESVTALLDEETASILGKTCLAFVSGIPSLRLPHDQSQPEGYYAQNAYIEALPVRIRNAVVVNMSAQHNIAEEFLGRYAALSVTDEVNRVEYVFRMRTETHFLLEPR